jgi:hypothetical protein
VRAEVAGFISARDGVPAHASDIFLSDGASPAAQAFLKALIRSRSDGVMVPIPQYPLYSASITLYGGELVPYYLDEENTWAMDINELQRMSILFQLSYKEKTNTQLLEKYIVNRMDTNEFFVNKAIGWALRAYAYTHKKWVIRFVQDHPQLSNLSKREALKHV